MIGACGRNARVQRLRRGDWGTEAASTEYDFAGEQTDDSTGLQYLRARYMDPATGTFISREPLASAPGWLGNPTAYAAGNPVVLVDPTGRWPLEKQVKSVSTIVPIRIPKFVPPGPILDFAAVGPYAAYYGSYQALGAIDTFSQRFGPAEPLVDVALLPITLPLVNIEATGLALDVAIDLSKDALGVGHGWADEGYRGSICPDPIEEYINCWHTYLPGVRPTVTVNEKGETTVDTRKPSGGDFRGPF